MMLSALVRLNALGFYKTLVTDFVTAIANADVSSLQGTKCTFLQTTDEMEQAVDSGKYGNVVQDYETETEGYSDSDWINRLAVNSKYAKSKGVKFGCSPQKQQLDNHAFDIGRYCDFVSMQINPTGMSPSAYAYLVSGYATTIKKANPNCKVFVQLNLGNDTTKTNYTDISSIVSRANAALASSGIDGDQIFYEDDTATNLYNLLTTYYKETGRIA